MRTGSGFDVITEIHPITTGWSTDRKYYLKTVDHKEHIIKLSPLEKLDQKRWEYEMLLKVAECNIMTAQIESYGIHATNSYMVFSWCHGDDLAAKISSFDLKMQYDLGVKAGEMLYSLHQIPIKQPSQCWAQCFQKVIERKRSAYKACEIHYPDDTHLLNFITQQQTLLHNRPQVLQHGDYHMGNMILSNDHKLHIIDFDRMNIGDPWEEFNRIVWSVKASPMFANGQIHGYFHNDIPDAFFKLMALYISVNTLSSLPWAIPYGEDEVHTMLHQYHEVMQWYDDMKTYKPNWYVDVSHLPF